MRLELNFTLNKKELPIDYRRIIVSFFKNTLENYDKDLFKMIYDVGQEKKVTFAPFFNPESFGENIIELKNYNIKIIFSTEDELLGLHFFNAFLLNLEKEYKFGMNAITLTRVIKLKEKEIGNEEVIFKILSPLLIREQINEKKSWYHLLDEKGIEILKKNLVFSLKNLYPEKYVNELKIVPIEIKKTVTKFYGIQIQGTLGTVKISGKKEILNTIYKSGVLSSRKSMGFGLVEILE